MSNPGKHIGGWRRRGWAPWILGTLIVIAAPTLASGQEEAQPVEPQDEVAGEDLEDAWCTYAGKEYGNQSVVCMEGQLFRCHASATAGIWRTEPEGRCARAEQLCYFEDEQYSRGALDCMLGKGFECSPGARWVEADVGKRCN